LTGFADEISADFGCQLQALRRLGLSWLEIRGVDKKGIDRYTIAEIPKVKQQLDDYGVSVSSLASPIGKIDLNQDFSAHLEHFKHVVTVAQMLKTKYIRIFSFYPPAGVLPENCKNQVIEQIGRLVDYAAAEDVILLHENEKDIYGDTGSRCLELMKEFGGSSFRAVFDFANFIQCDQDVWAAWLALKPYIEYVHIKDARYSDKAIVPAGQGDGRIREILAALKAGGYHGFLSLEPHLTEFEGLNQLEKDGFSMLHMQQLEGEDAFALALRALQDILSDL